MSKPHDGEDSPLSQVAFDQWLESRIREGVRATFQEIMKAEFSAFIGAEAHERTEERQGYRNGHRERGLDTRVGHIELSVPRDRAGAFETKVFERYARMESSLEEAMAEMYLQGVSTRRVREITEALCDVSHSASTQSEINQRLSLTLTTWRERHLANAMPYLYVDGLYVPTRWGGGVERVAVLVALGVDETGRREIVGVRLGYRESGTSWEEFFRWLLERGLHGMQLVIADAHAGIASALAGALPGVQFQRCTFHFTQNILDKVPATLRTEVWGELKAMFDRESKEAAETKAGEIMAQYGKRLPAAMTTLKDGLAEALTYFNFPKAHRRRIRTTNPLERVNEELRRRIKVISAFPNEDACMLLVTATAKRVSEGWDRRYLDMSLLAAQALEQKEAVAV